MPADYEYLGKQNIDVKGKIVIARYGELARNHLKSPTSLSAVGCIIYSDPRDDGYSRVTSIPMVHSVLSRVLARKRHGHPSSGNPLTPGWGSVKARGDLDRTEAKTS